MLQARYVFHPMIFRRPAGTSRGVLLSRQTWYLLVTDTDSPEITGIGECGLIPGLSPDDQHQVEGELKKLCSTINQHQEWLSEKGQQFPAIGFALETALEDLAKGGRRLFDDNDFTRGTYGIPINGLIWMGEPEYMQQQIADKLDAGFTCIKIKIGAIDFEQELALIASIRKKFDATAIEIRLDANGAFSADRALEYLDRLAPLHIHSVEQPIKQGQWKQMARLCADTPVAIALDEELIGIYGDDMCQQMLRMIQPHYIILKPSLLGGLQAADQWVSLAETLDIGWWATSALESNIGLNAIAQWTYATAPQVIQGLGTGQLYINNIPSPLHIEGGRLFHLPHQPWDLNALAHE
ncbi:MAG: o-succinylbenzoate synthase [Bacteroidales bacterium]